MLENLLRILYISARRVAQAIYAKRIKKRRFYLAPCSRLSLDLLHVAAGNDVDSGSGDIFDDNISDVDWSLDFDLVD